MINCINMLSEKYQRFTPTKILRYKGHFIKEYTNNILILCYENSIGTEYKKKTKMCTNNIFELKKMTKKYTNKSLKMYSK